MERGIPSESVLSTRDAAKSKAIRKKWRHFIDNSTLHGMQYVFNGETKVRSIIWTVFLVMGTAYFIYQSSVLLKRYYSYPITTKVTLKYEENPPFPAVTICNFNILKRSFVEKYKAEELIEYTFRDSQLLFENEINMSAINWSSFEGLDMEEVYKQGGHKIKEMLIRCEWSGEKCDFRNFTETLTSMGLCYTFNSDQGGREILKVKNAGSWFGLNLALKVQQNEYSTLTDQAGFKVIIHDQETPPMAEELGFSIGPGTTTFAAIRKTKVINLEVPYETNCSKSTISNIPGYSKYTIPSCMLTCRSKHVVEECGCRDIKLPALEDDPEVHFCDMNATATCVFHETANFYKVGGHDCNCQVPCEAIKYRSSLSYGTFPSKNVALCLEKKNCPFYTDGILDDLDADDLSENLLELNVFFQELSYQLIEQQPAYDDESLMGEVGGQLGLCIGASLLTVLEFCDIIITVLKIRFGPAEPVQRRKIKRQKAVKI